MAVTNDGRSILLTAQGDAVQGRICAGAIVVQGSAMTIGAEAVVSEFDGNVIGRCFIDAVAANIDVIPNSPHWIDGVRATTLPAGARIHINIL